MLEILCLVGIFFGTWKLGKFLEDLRDGLVDLEKRLIKLEKDAVKVTFSQEYIPTSFDKTKTNTSPKKRKPKTVSDWEEEIDLGGHE